MKEKKKKKAHKDHDKNTISTIHEERVFGDRYITTTRALVTPTRVHLIQVVPHQAKRFTDEHDQREKIRLQKKNPENVVSEINPIFINSFFCTFIKGV